MVSRIAAALAALAIAAGALILGASVVANQGLTYAGYISEVGVSGSPHAPGYRVGIVCLSGGLVLLGLAMRHAFPVPAGLLALGGLLSSAASVVSCSAGCPLPPYEVPTFADLVHAGVSVGAVTACVAAMAAVAFGPPASGLRAMCRGWLVLAMPLFLLAASSLLFVGRGSLTGNSERVLLAVIIVWAFVMAMGQSLRVEPPTEAIGVTKEDKQSQ